jgi:hypothetical protein
MHNPAEFGVPPEALTRFAEIAGVPPENRTELNILIQSSALMLWNVARRRTAWQKSGMKKAARRLASAAEELDAAIADAGPDAIEIIRLSIPPPRPQSLVAYQRLTRQVRAAARFAATAKDSNPWRVFREMFHDWLETETTQLGGKLTLYQNADTGGTLADAYNILAPYLPPDFAAPRSFSTLRRLRRRGQKKRKPSRNS